MCVTERNYNYYYNYNADKVSVGVCIWVEPCSNPPLMRPLDERAMSPRTVALGLQERLVSVSIRRDHVSSKNQQPKHTKQH